MGKIKQIDIATARTVNTSLNIVVGGGFIDALNWEQLYLGEPAPTIYSSRQGG
jgi:hypothetical protein